MSYNVRPTCYTNGNSATPADAKIGTNAHDYPRRLHYPIPAITAGKNGSQKSSVIAVGDAAIKAEDVSGIKPLS